MPVLALAVLLWACGDSSGPNDPLPNDATSAIGLTVRDEVEVSLDALTLPTQLAPLGSQTVEPCATPSDPTDGDGDGIPDQATYTFTAPPCRFADVRGTSLDLVGQLQITDPAPQSAGFGYGATLVSLRSTFTGTDPDHSYSVTRNGTRTLGGSIAGLQLVTDLQLLRTFPGLSDAAVDQQWTVAFAPEASLRINQPLPAGMLDLSGSLSWNRGAESFALTITTPTPLHFDPACEGPQRFDAGELQAAGTFGDLTGYVRMRWTACGAEPAVDFVEQAQS
jgi:hypothetical protein